MRNHPQKGPYPKHNTPGTRGASPVRSCTLSLIQKKQKNLIDWVWPVKNVRSYIWPVQTNRWLLFVHQIELGVVLPMAKKHQTALVSQITIPMRLTSPRMIVCQKIILLQFAAFLRVHFYSKIDYTFTLSDQYAWLATKCPYSRVPKKKRDQQAAVKQ